LTTLLCAITITMLGSSAMLFQYNQDLVQREIPTTVVAAGAGVDNVTKILAKAKVKPTQAIILSSKLVYAEIRLRDQADQVRKQPGVYNVI
ncbi:ABC transporter permease, partial [Lacticaseibacillus paracasei]